MAPIVDTLKAIQKLENSLSMFNPLSDCVANLADQFANCKEVMGIGREQMIGFERMTESHRKFMESLSIPAFDVSQNLTRMLDSYRVDPKLLELLQNASGDWRASFQATETLKLAAIFPLETHLTKLFDYSALAETSLAAVRLEGIGIKLGINDALRHELAMSHQAFSLEFQSIFHDLEKDKLRVLELSKALTELPAVEYMNQAALIASTAETEDDYQENEDEREARESIALESADALTNLILDFNPELYELLAGARQAYTVRQPDFVRHFTTSFRELFTQVLHALAPDQQIRLWTLDTKDYHNGRPTRAARIRYATRHVGVGYGGFVKADVESVLIFIDSFQKGTHGVRPSFTEEQLIDLKTRMEGLLLLLITVPRTP